MKCYFAIPTKKERAMTLVEILAVIFIIAFLAMMFMPPLSPPPRIGSGMTCANRLKRVDLAEKIWAGDHNDLYPMAVSVTNGGTRELMNTPDAWKTYLVMSNELYTPIILLCPEDVLRGRPATNFDDNLKGKISYLIGLDSTDTNPAAIAFGDDNFLLNNLPANHGQINVATNASLTWDTTRHSKKNKTESGNIGFCDGSVQAANNQDLQKYLQRTGFATNRFFAP